MEKHVLSVLVENQSGVLSRMAGLISRRGYNIDSLSVGETEDAAFSRMTIVVRSDQQMLEQMKKQIRKLVDVVKITELKSTHSIYRELVLAKVRVPEDKRVVLENLIMSMKGRIVDMSNQGYFTVEFTGDQDQIESFIDLMHPYGILEMVRTGMTALGKFSA
ncbi:MAG: acetolactate synthase small subunit [Clostridiales bacterium]|jgi:acetolactate synthase-1/3 small subunit|nr:acetolactate synthase small subunit [Clostridiales bacterium]